MAQIISNTVCPQIDIILANAGLAKLAPFGSMDEKFFDLHFDVNLKGLFFSVQKGLPLMKDRGGDHFGIHRRYQGVFPR